MDNVAHLLTSAVADFRRDKIRTALTSLGIMVGVLSVVMLIALGLGLKNYIQKQFQNLGANLILVLPGQGLSGGPGPGLVGGAEFDEKDVTSLKRIEGLQYVVPAVFKSVAVEAGTTEKTGYLLGVNEEYFDLIGTKVLAGEYFSRTEVGNRSKVVVLGFNLADQLFDDPADAVGRTIRVQGIRLRVLGVNEKTGDNEQDRAVIMPYTTTYGSLNPNKTFWSIYLGVPTEEAVTKVKEEAEQVLLRRYKADEFEITEQAEILSTINQIFGVINLVLVAIGSISLVVGGIGIMNIMYATVTERTKEIGIRRAIGATKRDILSQFLTESVVLSALGGVVGLLLATVIILIVRIWFPVALNFMAVVMAIGVSSAIGIFFGVFPAKKAADLSPIDAIRYE
ncbi:MAG: ABC transporter permease [Microgenomates group bacterium]